MDSLTHYLETMWKETDRAAMVGYIKSWPKLNAKRKEVKFALGDYVMLHQPVHIPKAPTALVTCCCVPWKITKKTRKDFELTHIDSARTTVQTVSNVTSAPVPMHPQDYDDRFNVAGQIVRPIDRIAKDATVARSPAGNMWWHIRERATQLGKCWKPTPMAAAWSSGTTRKG